MAIGSSLVPLTTPIFVNGTIHEDTQSQLGTRVTGTDVMRTASKHYACVYRGQHISFEKGVGKIVSADFAAWLATHNAPVS